jgi:hypothetical protein
MARTPIQINTLKGTSGDAQTAVITTAADVANGHNWVFQEGDILVARNNHGSVGGQVTLKAVANANGRLVDSVRAVPPLSSYVFGPLTGTGWATSAGVVEFDIAAGGTLVFSVERLPRQ